MNLRSSTQSQSAQKEAEPATPEPPRQKSRRARAIRRDKVNITLKCFWGGCTFEHSSEETYNAHVVKHIPNPDAVFAPESSDWAAVSRCRWANCDHCSLDMGELRRHTLYHALQCKLVALGQELLERSGVAPCRLSSAELHLVPDVSSPFRCAWDDCRAEFDEPQIFFKHVPYHVRCHYFNGPSSRNATIKCLWEGCDHTTHNQYHLLSHMRCHTLERKVSCSVCGATFVSNGKLYDHCIRQAPIQELRFQCSHCLKLFSTESLLRNHIRNHINSYRCNLCGMTLPCPAGLREHIKYRHSDQKDHACDRCDKRFKGRHDLMRHKLIHNPDDNISCPVMGCTFKTRYQFRLRKHCKSKHSGEKRQLYVCHLCDARFVEGHKVTKHLRRRHQLALPEGHTRFCYRLGKDGNYRLETLRYESLDVAEQMELDGAGGGEGAAGGGEPDVLSLTCRDGDAPDTIQTDDGRELRLPEPVRAALATGARVLVCVQGEQVQLLGQTDAAEQLDDPDDPEALMLVVDNPAP